MSNQREVENSLEQPFQVVQKRYSNQSRRGVTRDKAPHSKSQGYSEDSPRKRHASQHHHLKHERDSRDSRPRPIPRSSHSHTSSRGDPTRGGREGQGHRHRENSWEAELKGSSVGSGGGSSLEKITSPNRFERLSTTETSNRFERLNPDAEAPGDTKGGEKRTRSHPLKGSAGLRGSRKSSKEEENIDVVQGEKMEEVKDLPESPADCLEVATIEHKDVNDVGKVEDKDTSEETEKEGKPARKRHAYPREVLMGYRGHPLSLQRPKGLKEEYFRGGKWCAEAWLNPSSDKQETELPEEGTLKHPTALTLLREHDTKHLGKVSLSPQRRSFGSGCSWKEMSLGNSSNSAQTSSSSPANQSNFLSEERDELFFEMEGPTSPRSLPQTPSPRPPSFSPFQGHPPPSPLLPPPPPLHLHTPRVIDHVPLRDRERERKNWRQREPNWWQGGHKHLGGEGEDDEPEWMAFGPSDRNEVIELKGLEEHEREREARRQTEKEPSPTELSEDESQELERMQNDGGEREEERMQNNVGEREEKEEEEVVEDEFEEKLLSPKVSESSSVGVEEGMVERGTGKVLETAALENEFILDGFDFSTGVSICQELAADEEEDLDYLQVDNSNPTELSTALMKALRVKEQQQEENHVLGVDTRPVNALTLDEIQARENIHTPLSHPGDQSAFNKFVAQLQFTGAIQHEEKPPVVRPIQRRPNLSPVQTLPQQNFPLPQPIRLPPERRAPANTNFGYLLERELDFDEDLPPPLTAHPPSLPPQLPLPRGEHLNRREGSHGQFPLQSQDYDTLSSNIAHPLPHRPEPSQDKWMDGAWVYPETQAEPMRQLDQRYSAHHRLAAVRNQQMMAAAASGGRLGSNHWAVEMEMRRLQELQLMRREREMLNAQAAHHMAVTGSHQKSMMSKPSISLLPTSVMRHLHNTKQNQSEMTRGSSAMANRLDQELTSKASQTHLALSSMLNHPDMSDVGARDYPPHSNLASAHMRAPPPHYANHLQRMTDPTLYPQFLPTMPHGMPAQHPYMH